MNTSKAEDVNTNEWQSSEHALAYLERADSVPHRTEGEAVLLDFVPISARRILDLGTGNGRLVQLLMMDRPEAEFVALDFSPAMLARARERFAAMPNVLVREYDLSAPLPDLGQFDAVVSSFAIHHLTDRRKRALYGEVFNLLRAGGQFCNLEHVSSPTPALRERFWRAYGQSPDDEDPSNKLLDLQTQLTWLRGIGFDDVDCAWKWLELALLVGRKP